MLIEMVDIGVEVRTLHLVAGLVLGLAFGIAAQVSRFCLRRAVAGDMNERTSAGAVWATALFASIFLFAIAQLLGFVALEDHRYMSASLPLAAVVIGGLAFGIGMVLTRGCVSRLTVLSGTGNLRAVVVLMIFAVTAHMTLKGVLAPVRTSLGAITVEAPFGSLNAVPLVFAAVAPFVLAIAVTLARKSEVRASHLALGVLIGAVAVGGWIVTSVLLFDEFDPLPVQSAAFTLPWSDTLFWLIASTAIPAGFGVGFIVGVLSGSFLSAAARGELAWQGFEGPSQMLRYGAGGILMGFGGVLAGGCTVGAGLSGTATGSLTAFIALLSIIAGGWAAQKVVRGSLPLPATA